MITLLTFPSGFEQFSVSSFCVKAALLLNHSGLEWQRCDMKDPRKMPFGKLPAIEVGDRIIADTAGIQSYLEERRIDFQIGLTQKERAQTRSLVALAEDNFYFHMMLDRWGNDDVWPIIREEYFDEVPRLIRKIVTNKIRKDLLHGMTAQGLARFSIDQRAERVAPDLAAIATLLKNTPYLFGDKPTLADFAMGPVLAGIATTPSDTPLRQLVTDNEVLQAYANRVCDPLL